MKKIKRIFLIASVVLSISLIAAAVFISRSRAPDAPVMAPHDVTMAELAANDGKNGHACLVAVDGTVYQIRGFALWEAGRHKPSNGKAYCGADMSKVIDEAPHGRSALKLLIVVGKLIQ